jgi:hypothetical protein
MTPIINPMFFYWLDVADASKVVSMLASIILAIIAVTLSIIMIDFDGESSGFKRLSKIRKISLIVAVVCLIFGIFIPSKDTMYKMAAASFVTEDNIEYVVEKGKDGIEYIVEVIEDAFNGEDEEEENKQK